ncbi:hypothetical protein SynRS9915_01021 [Synechococcus sp. RS9915]|nr:hypothetical protein SynRS9915_01021 [Synechococcus sp. RS9915]
MTKHTVCVVEFRTLFGSDALITGELVKLLKLGPMYFELAS